MKDMVKLQKDFSKKVKKNLKEEINWVKLKNQLKSYWQTQSIPRGIVIKSLNSKDNDSSVKYSINSISQEHKRRITMWLKNT